MLDKYYQLITNVRETRLLLWLFIIAIVVRAIGMHYGYWHGDERINDAAKVLTGQLVPGQHFYPPLLNYINAVFFGILFVIGRLIPIWYSAAEFRAQYFSDPTVFYLTARLVVVFMSAAVAPLFYLIAKSLKFSRSSCIIAGAFGVFIPVMLLLSHLSKSDIPLATSAVLVVYVMLEKYKNLEKIKYDIFLGLAIALTLSFKHSYVFILAPLMLGHAYLHWRLTDINSTFKSLFITGIVMFIAWCILNIGILLDFKNFLDFQKIQAQMSIREGELFVDALSTWFMLAVHTSYGVNIVVTLLFIVFPFYINSKYSRFSEKALLNICWLSVAFGTLILVIMSGMRQHSGLWVPYFTLMQLFAALLLLDCSRAGLSSIRLASVGLSVITLILSFYGSSIIWKQTLAKPIADEVAQFVEEKYSDRKIIASFELRLPKKKEAQEAEFARHDRIAAKYNVTLPERSQERYIKKSAPDAIYYFGMPGVMFGLENTDDDSLGDAIKPYTWPLQKEEWVLDYWIDKGFDVFVLADHHYYLNETPVQVFRNFYGEIENRCNKTSVFNPVKSFFLEATVTVFDCRVSSS